MNDGEVLATYHGGGEPEGEEAQAQVMQAWMSWFGGLGAAVVDGGNPIGMTTMVGSGGTASVGAGDPVTGYSVIEADSMDAAVEIAKGCPHLQAGGTVEVGETYDAMAAGAPA